MASRNRLRPCRSAPVRPERGFDSRAITTQRIKTTPRGCRHRRELAILASQRACMRIVIRGLAAVLLEFPAHPAPVPDADQFHNRRATNKNDTARVSFLFVGGDGGN